MLRSVLALVATAALAASACADAPNQVGQIPSFTKTDLDQWFIRDSLLAVTSEDGLIGVLGARFWSPGELTCSALTP